MKTVGAGSGIGRALDYTGNGLLIALLGLLVVAGIATAADGLSFLAFYVAVGGPIVMVLLITWIRGFDFFEPIWPVIGMSVFSYVLRAIGLERGQVVSFGSGFTSYAEKASLPETLGLVALSLTAFMAGYITVRPAVRPWAVKSALLSDYRVANSRFRSLAICSLILSSFALVVMIQAVGGLPQFRIALSDRLEAFQGLGFIAVLVPVAIAVTCLWILAAELGRWKSTKWSMFAMFTLSSLVVLGLGSRGRLVTVLLIVSWVWIKIRQPSFKALKWTALGVSLLFLLGVLIEFRGRPDEGLDTAIARELISYQDQGFGSIIVGQARQTPELDLLTVIVANVPDRLVYQKGITYAALGTAFFPASVFPWKLPGASHIVNDSFFPERYQEGTGAGLRSGGILGELYLNFGFIGCVVMMFFFGAGLRWLYLRVGRQVNNAHGSPPKRTLTLFMYVVVWAHLPQLVRGEFMGTGISVVIFILVGVLATRFVFSGAPNA